MRKLLKTVFVSLLCITLSGISLGATESKRDVGSKLPPDTMVIEAESAIQKDDGVQIIPKEGASGGAAVVCQPLSKAYYEVDLPSAGTWYVWVRLYCPGGDADSYWIGMDNSAPYPQDDARNGDMAVRVFTAPGDSVNNANPYMIWYWDAGKANYDPKSKFTVNQSGKTRLWIKGREAGTVMDTIILTMDQDFNPEIALKGGPITPSAYKETPQTKAPGAVKLKKPLKILFIGNSATFAVPRFLNRMVQNMQTEMVASGGLSLEDHWNKGEALRAIHKTKWNFVVLQDVPIYSLLSPERTYKYMRLFDEAIKKNRARTVWFMTHPYTMEYFAENKRPVTTTYQMLDSAKAVSEKMGKELKVLVAPVGLVWCNYAGITDKQIKKNYNQLYTYDGIHASEVGSYLTACVFYSTITGRDPDELPDLGISDAKGIKQSVREVVKIYSKPMKEHIK